MSGLLTCRSGCLKLTYEIPEQEKTRNGYIYYTGGKSWSIVTDTGRLNFHFGDIGVSPSLVTGFKGFIAARLRSENPRSVYANYQWLRSLLLDIATYDPATIEISSAHLMNYQAALEERHRYRSTQANDVIRIWARLGIPGVSEEAFAAAADMPKHKRNRALAVRLRCPMQGAYSNLEYDGLYKALHAAFASGKIRIDNYALCLLSGAIGPRPVQIASLMIGDLKLQLALRERTTFSASRELSNGKEGTAATSPTALSSRRSVWYLRRRPG